MRYSIIDKSDIAIPNSNRFKRATLEHKDFPNAKLYFRNCSILTVARFFQDIDVAFIVGKGSYNVINKYGECITVKLHENIQEKYIGYTLFI